MNNINFVQINNPMDPRDCTRTSRTFKTGQSLNDIFPPVIGSSVDLVYTMNGQVLSREEMALSYPVEGDWVTACPVPEGGDSAKSILRIVAIIAIATVMPQMAAMADFALMGQGIMLSNASFAIMQAGMSVAGAMLVNALLPPPKPPSLDESSESPTYGIDGAKNTSAEGVVVPVIYGTYRYGGNIISNYVVTDGPTQYLHMLINCGEGPIASITDILVNDQPIESYKDAIAETKYLGAADQGAIPWFADSITPRSVNQKIVHDAWKTYTTQTAVDQVRLDIAGPLFGLNDEGGYQNASVVVNIQYRKQGTLPWLSFQGINEITGYTEVAVYHEVPVLDSETGNPTGATTVYVPTGSEFRSGNEILRNNPIDQRWNRDVVGHYEQVPIYGTTGTITLTNGSRSTYRRSIMSAKFSEVAIYEVRMQRTTPVSTSDQLVDELFWTDLNEITLDDVGYRGTAVLPIRIRLNDQISGMPTVTHLNGGKIVSIWSEEANAWRARSTRNPAWITLDVLTNKRYGGGCAMSRVDLRAWKLWAKHCDNLGLTFDGVFDTQKNVWDAMTEIARCGHAQITCVGTRYSVVVEKDTAPSMMFSVANMVAGSFRETWLPMNERANEIEVTFNDELDNFAPRTIRVYDANALTAGLPVRTSNIQIKGIVTAQRAYEEAMLQLNLNRYVRRTVSFAAPLDAIACSVGDVVLVQHDMPKWGDGGRFEAGSTTSVMQLDRPVTMEVGKTYQLMAHFDAVQRYSGASIISVIGNSIVLAGFAGQTNIKRLKVGLLDVEVESVYQSGLNYGVIVRDATGITAGANAWQLWDTNVMETRNVVFSLGTWTAVTLQTPLPTSPSQFSKWLFGETNKVAKPFRVRAIAGGNEYQRELHCIEYNASVYSPAGAVPTINYSSLDPLVTGLVLPSVIDTVYESVLPVGSVYETRVTVAYRGQQETYETSSVFLSRNGGSPILVGTDPSEVTVSATKGEVLKFTVVARDRLGRNAAVSTSPTQSITVAGRNTVPGTVTGLSVSATDEGVVVIWDKPLEIDWTSTTVRLNGSDWNTASALFDGKAIRAVTPFRGVGTQVFRVRHSIPGVLSPEATFPFVVNSPLTVTFQGSEQQSGSVTVRWNSAKTTQPIRRYIVRVGDAASTWAGIGTNYLELSGDSLSHTFSFDLAGTKKIWIVAEDMAGNQGTPAALTVDVQRPPGALNMVVSPGVVYNGNDLTKVSGSAPWATQGYSLDAFTGGAFISFKVGTTFNSLMCGLNSDPTTDAGFTSIDYAWQAGGDGQLYIYQSGSGVGLAESYSTDTVLSIVYDNVNVYFYKDGVLKSTIEAVGANRKFHVDSSFESVGGSIKNLRFGPSGARGANGTNGTNGTPGARGASRFSKTVAAPGWVDATATLAVTEQGYPSPVNFDEVTLYRVDGTYGETRYYFGGSWLSVAAVINGNLLVKNSVLADRVDTRGLSIKDDAGNVIFAAGSAVIPTTDVRHVGDKNLSPVYLWKVGFTAIGDSVPMTGNVGAWLTNGIAYSGGAGPTHSINFDYGPDNIAGPIWRSTSGTGGEGQGGYRTMGASNPIDRARPYRFAQWVRMGGDMSGTFYQGCASGDVLDLPGLTVNGNPYMVVRARSAFVPWRWYLAVGYVFPQGYTNQLNLSGIYDGVTGEKVFNGVDFAWTGTASEGGWRCYQFYTTAAGAITDFAPPLIHVLDGSEPSIDELLAGAAVSGRNKITSGNVTTYIANLAIGNAQIGGDIQSDNFAAGTSGWRIRKATGEAEFGAASIRGQLSASNLIGSAGSSSRTTQALTLTSGTVQNQRVSLTGFPLTLESDPLIANPAQIEALFEGDIVLLAASSFTGGGGTYKARTQIMLEVQAFNGSSWVNLANDNLTESNTTVILTGSEPIVIPVSVSEQISVATTVYSQVRVSVYVQFAGFQQLVTNGGANKTDALASATLRGRGFIRQRPN